MKRKLWTKEEDAILKEHYHSKGSIYCSTLINWTRKQINGRASILGIKISKKIKAESQSEVSIKAWENIDRHRVECNKFIKDFDKESVYILGFLWADGYLNNTSQSHKIVLEITSEDLDDIIPVFMTTGKWGISYRNRENRKPQGSIFTSNFVIYDFLVENDYRTKSTSSADKILWLIPEELRRYWWRGYFDGDGYLYIDKGNCYQIGLCGSYEQDWEFVKKLLTILNIKFYKQEVKRKNGNRYSNIRITSKAGCLSFCNYIYDEVYDEIGLRRKFNKFVELSGI